MKEILTQFLRAEHGFPFGVLVVTLSFLFAAILARNGMELSIEGVKRKISIHIYGSGKAKRKPEEDLRQSKEKKVKASQGESGKHHPVRR